MPANGQPYPPQGAAPQGGGIDINQLLQMLMQILTQPPDQPAGNVPSGLPPTGVPASTMQMSPEMQQMAQLNQMAQMLQMQQSGQQSMNAVQGGAGGMFGGMGGRPPGS